MTTTRPRGQGEDDDPRDQPGAETDDQALLSELEELRAQADRLLSVDDVDADSLDEMSTGEKERPMTRSELPLQIQDLDERIRRLEGLHRQQVIRRAARFGADTHVARGRAPVGWNGESRFAFEEELRRHLDAELKELDQDEANALAFEWMELAHSTGDES